MKDDFSASASPAEMIEGLLYASLRQYALRSLVVGLSGGADSTSLLKGLTEVRRRFMPDLRLTAVHCNFHLRGAESDRDEEFCRHLCEESGVALRVFQCPVGEWRKTHTGSDEIACREMRYAHFREVMEQTGADAVAVAHNSDDRVETLLLNLMRGAGSAGLRAMQPFRDGLFRPFLKVSRREIEEYLKEKGQDYVTDSTNLQSLYRRNFLRNRVIPLLEEEWPGAKESILKSADILSEERKIIDRDLEETLPAGAMSLRRETALAYPSPETLFLHFLAPHGGTASLAREVAHTLRLPYSGRKWPLSDSVTLWEERDGWSVRSVEEVSEVPELWIESKTLTPEVMGEIKKAPLSECWTDSGVKLEWRRWRRGDRLRPLGMKGSKLVSDILTEGRVANHEKTNFHVLAVPGTNEVIWVPNLKRSRLYLVGTPSQVTRYSTAKE